MFNRLTKIFYARMNKATERLASKGQIVAILDITEKSREKRKTFKGLI